MNWLSGKISKFLICACRFTGKPIAFLLALLILFLWALIGYFRGFTDSWMIVINTIATINASLMVFIIQYTQYRESKALHLKIDGLIKSIEEAENELISIENKEEHEFDRVKKKIFTKHH
jgi:low affinity Fe/Cu permease